MTEKDWIGGADPQEMLNLVLPISSRRKLILFAVGFVREKKHTDRATTMRCVLAERLADGNFQNYEPPVISSRLDGYLEDRWEEPWLWAAAAEARWQSGLLPRSLPDETLRHLLREVYGNPFRSGAVESNWLTENVLCLAQKIYDDRCFDHLPILADALMDAGCFHEPILNHCRSEGPHVRGCWVIDMLLGRE